MDSVQMLVTKYLINKNFEIKLELKVIGFEYIFEFGLFLRILLFPMNKFIGQIIQVLK